MSSRRISSRLATGFGSVFVHAGFGLAAVLGIMAQVGAIGAYRRGDADLPTAIAIFAFSLILTVIGLGFYYFRYAVFPAQQARAARRLAQNPGAPWLLDEDWAARKVVDRGSRTVAIFLWIWSIGWNGLCALIWSVNRDKIIAAFSESWGDAAVAVLFPMFGLIGVLCAISATVHWWRYGASTLHIDTLPGYLGETFRGRVVARLAVPVPLEVELVCERRFWARAMGRGGRSMELKTEQIWSKSYPIDSDRLMRTPDGLTSIPVDVPLPAGKQGTSIDEEGVGVRWALAVHTDHARASGPVKSAAPGAMNYAARFLIPVFARE
jgi:hypothetical protein